MRRRHALAVTAGLAALAGTPAIAQAAPTDMLSGRFRVELRGVQRTTWKTQHAAQFECDVNINGSGSETIRFRSKPAVVDVRAFGRTAIVTRGRGAPVLDLRSTIARTGTIATTGTGTICADGDGGGGPPPAADCGTKRSSVPVRLGWFPGRRQLIGFVHELAAPLGPFSTCPTAGIAWPSLLDRNTDGRPVGQALPARELFEHGKSGVVAHGREVQDDGETQSTTTIDWHLDLWRIDERADR